ncbi:MAG: iron ABC transporter permease [Alphaproteobacteria bacterium]|nr:iron ABC transporter permease [Alphaproteobacteria bacterium]
MRTVIALTLVLALALVSLLVGRAGLPPTEIWQGLTGDGDMPAAVIVRELRLPRTILALAIGAGLGLAGAVLQGLLRNPLAEPGIVGVSGLAALGAVIAFYSGWSQAFALALPLGGMLGAALAAILVLVLAGRAASVVTLILAGVAVNSLAGALTALALSLSPNPFALYEIMFWLMGSLSDREWRHVWLALPPMAIGWAVLATTRRGLAALTLGEASARSLGIDLGRLKLAAVLGTALAVGAGVAVAGAIGFVGLVVPHLLRPLVGHRPEALLLPSALGGALLTLAADIAVRLTGPGPELRIGVLTALIGAPFFLLMVLRRREAWR